MDWYVGPAESTKCGFCNTNSLATAGILRRYFCGSVSVLRSCWPQSSFHSALHKWAIWETRLFLFSLWACSNCPTKYEGSFVKLLSMRVTERPLLFQRKLHHEHFGHRTEYILRCQTVKPRRFATGDIKTRYCTRSWVSFIHLPFSQPVSARSILMLSFHIIDIQNLYFPRGFCHRISACISWFFLSPVTYQPIICPACLCLILLHHYNCSEASYPVVVYSIYLLLFI